MRITNRMMSDTVLNNLSNNLQRLQSLEDQLTSGKRISRLSDDPPAVGRSLSLRAGIAAGDQFLRNMDAGVAWLQATDTSLGSATDVLQRARELAVQGANDTLTPSQRAAIGSEVDQLLQQMLIIGNSSLRSQRLFAGLVTNVNPFAYSSPPPTVTYSGDTGQMLREIDTGTTLSINVTGDTVFPPIFTAMMALRDDLNSNNSASLQSADLSNIDAAIDGLMTTRADVGAKINRLETAKDRQQQLQIHLTALLSKAEDTDFTQAISDFTNQQTTYQAGLNASAKAIQPSLLDYLR